MFFCQSNQNLSSSHKIIHTFCYVRRNATGSGSHESFTVSLQARVLAVLDWELSTTGQPIADLAYFLMPHYWPSHYKVISTIGGVTGVKGGASLFSFLLIYFCRVRNTVSFLPVLALS